MTKRNIDSDPAGGDARAVIAELQCAAHEGDAGAQYACYLYGNMSSRADQAAALRWLRRAARQGHIEAMFEYGRTWCYLNVWQLSAVRWVSRAAAAGHAQAQYTLGKWYEQGWGVPQSFEQAVYWYWRAALNGEAFARQKLNEVASQRTGRVAEDIG